jgi:hypothetical protein
VRIDPEKQGTVNLVLLAIEADRLGDRQDMPLIEGLLERTTAVSGRAEDNTLLGDLRMRPLFVVRGNELGDVNEIAGWPALGSIFIG